MDTEARIAALESEVKSLRAALESRCDFLNSEHDSQFERIMWIGDKLIELLDSISAAEERIRAADVKLDILGNIVWPTYYKVFPDMAEVDRLLFDNAPKKSKKEDEG
jgi:hypothetical protein